VRPMAFERITASAVVSIASGIASSLAGSTTATDALANLTPGAPPEERNAEQALRDLTLPESLTTSIALLFQELGYTLAGGEIADRHGGGRRKLTLASRLETSVRHFLHIPQWILDDPNYPNPQLVSQLGQMLPKQLRVFVLSEGLDSPADYWKDVAEPSWRDVQVEAEFVAWRWVTRDLTAKAREDQLTSIRTRFGLETNGTAPSPASPDPNVRPRKQPYVFISYSWEQYKEDVPNLANWLRPQGVEAWIDQWVIGAPKQGWPQWMQDQVEKANFVLIVCTESYKRRLERKEPRGSEGEPVGRGVTWESTAITNELYNSPEGQNKFIPIVFANKDLKYVPRPLEGYNVYDVSTAEGRRDLYLAITQQRLREPAALGDIVDPAKLELPSELGPVSW